jgi:hypothetical protein
VVGEPLRTLQVSSKTVQHGDRAVPEYVKTMVKLLPLYSGLVHRLIQDGLAFDFLLRTEFNTMLAIANL